jgi:hypothetical protein
MLKGEITPDMMNWSAPLEWFPPRYPLQLYDPQVQHSMPLKPQRTILWLHSTINALLSSTSGIVDGGVQSQDDIPLSNILDAVTFPSVFPKLPSLDEERS